MDIGGTKVAAGVVDESGGVVDRVIEPTPSHSPQAVEDVICSAVRTLRRRFEFPLRSVGIGAAGWVDISQSVVAFSPHLAWRSEPLRERLSKRIDLPLIVDNDANAAAWAEYRFGAGTSASVMVCITLGTGIGGGLIVNGQLFRGAYGMAGEWGHMTVVPGGERCECGNRGCWEQYASGNALVREARDLIRSNSPVAHRLLAIAGGNVDSLSGPQVTAAALQGEPNAIELICDAGQWLGRGIANLVSALDPEVIVIGGGLSTAGDLLLHPAQEAFHRSLPGRGYRPEASLVLAACGADAGLVGAADLARHAMVEPRKHPRAGFWPRRQLRPSRRRRFAEQQL